ncbi:MAG: aspartate aminotransferase family protein [Pseudomonadota bacterium]
MLKEFLDKFRTTPLLHHDEPALMPVFKRQPVSFVRGRGSILWDDEDNAYLDALGGIAVTILGHSHPRISEAISLQADRLLHVSNHFHIQEQARLGEKFCAIAEMDKVFFANSGAEANEAAIKIARAYGHSRGIKYPTIITAKKSFHGRTMATLSATGNPALQAGFEPMLANFIHVDFNSLDAVGVHADNEDVVAVMVEPILGESGIIVPDEGYLRSLRQLCDEHGWFLILDEIQTGMGRTGKWFAYQHENVLPDVMTSAKALANGIPIGACAARGKAAAVLTAGTHGSTFGGNPLACKIALTTIDIIEQDALLEAAHEMGLFLRKQLQQQIGTHAGVVDIRGKGMMLAVELDQAHPDLASLFLAAGLVVNITGGGKIIRLLPAINISDAEAKKIIQIVHDVVCAL